MADRKEDWPISGINVGVSMLKMRGQDKSSMGSATGFFFRHNNKKYLITNRHVVIDEPDNYYPHFLEIKVHKSKTDYSSNNVITIQLYCNNKPTWFEHSEYNANQVDVVAIPLDMTTMDNDNFSLFNHSIINFMSIDNFHSNVNISSFGSVIIVGYPLGFYDHQNNLPVYRKGMISSSYPIHFNHSPYFLIDAMLHEGTSGSPVLNSSDNVLINEKGAFHSDFTYLLGIHSAEHVVNDEPLSLCVVWYPEVILEIIEGQIPTQQGA